MTGAAPAIRVIGSQFSPESLRIREFLARTRVPHEWLDADRDPQVEALLGQFGIAATELPVVIATGTVLRRATPGDVAGYLGLTVESLPERCFDLVVVGGGPAGLAAAVYGASEGLRTLGVEMTAPGGQAGMSSRIENYLGFPMGVSGAELTQRAIIQAEKFGASLTAPCTVVSLGSRGRISGGATERRKRGRGTGRHRRNRRLLPPTGGLTTERLRRQRRVLRRHRDGGTHVRPVARCGRRRWQLGRPSGHLSEPGRVRGHARHPRPGSRQGHVALSGRTSRGRPPHHASDTHDRRRSGRGRDPTSRASRWPRRQDRPPMRRTVLLHRSGPFLGLAQWLRSP